MNRNNDIKAEMKRAGVSQWRVAEKLGVAESTLIRWLRFPLSPEREAEIMAAIRELAQERSGGNV